MTAVFFPKGVELTVLKSINLTVCKLYLNKPDFK